MAGVVRFTRVPATFSSEYFRVASATYLGSNARARAELGASFRPLEAGLRETLAFELDRLCRAA